ncbi:MAG: epsE [Gammaproteobacteria bacterium]|jgi:polysaccharide export outer membrane protein|nr:epsE [Gammaproteobacteria bacterium]
MFSAKCWRPVAGALLCLMQACLAAGAPPTPAVVPAIPKAADRPLLQLGPGDQVKMDVFGRPEMDTTTYVADDGSIRVPLAGKVMIGGLSPSEAGQKVEAALKKGQYLVDPHVTFTVVQSRSQRVSVLGEVRAPGRYPIESNTTVLDLLAQAGGATEKGADIIYILRADPGGGNLQRYAVNLKGTVDSKDATPAVLQTLRGGDSIFVPIAEQFYIAGEVRSPAMYRLESGMTLVQAIARAGGITERGSTSRVQIKRRGPKGDYIVISGKSNEKIQADDVITVKERIF